MADIVNFIYFSELLNNRVTDAKTGKTIGRMTDFAAVMSSVFPKVTGIMVKTRGSKTDRFVPWKSIRRLAPGRGIAVEYSPGPASDQISAGDAEILLKKTFLDKQIISISGNKVVRVNDLHLLIDNSAIENSNLWLVHIDIGIRGLLRRMRWEKFINGAFRWITSRDIREKFVPWKHVQPTATTNLQGSVHLKIDASKLSLIHPADLADIFEDLGIDERSSLLDSLSIPNAAATLQEMPVRIRVQVAEMSDPGRLADIINSMQTDDAVDLLDEISPEHRSAVYSRLSADRAAELKELSKLSIYSVGSIMGSDYLTAASAQTIGEAFDIIRARLSQIDFISYIYVTDPEEHLLGVVPMRQLLSSPPSTPLGDVMDKHVVSVLIDTNIKRVAQIFFKYNFKAVPVVDEENRIQGIITQRDALEYMFPEMKQESDFA